MSLFRTALAVFVCVACYSGSLIAASATERSITLESAFARTLERHPDGRRLPFERDSRRAESDQAALKPALVGGVSIENAFGSGANSGLRAAELSLSLSSVLERGDKRLARMAVAQRRFEALDTEAKARQLDLLAEVARRYLDALVAQEFEAATTASVAQRAATVEAAARRVSAGAAPASVRLSAVAALARARLDEARAREIARSARRRLALLWGEREASFGSVAGNLLELPQIASFDALAQKLDAAPDLQKFASEARVREARLQLARSASRSDIDWQIGVRRLQAERDLALIGSVSIPFGSARRAAPGIAAAEAELALLDLEKESTELSLYATLADAHGRLLADSSAVIAARDEVLPKLQEAESVAGKTYRAGALSYLEWAQLQADLLAARRDQIEAARDFHRALIEIQRLTDDAFLASPRAIDTSLMP